MKIVVKIDYDGTKLSITLKNDEVTEALTIQACDIMGIDWNIVEKHCKHTMEHVLAELRAYST